MKDFSVGAVFRKGFNLFRFNFGPILFLFTLLVICSHILAGVLTQPLAFVFSFIGFYFSFGLTNVCLHIAKGQEPQYDQMLVETRLFLNYLLATFTVAITGVFVGFIGLILWKFLSEIAPNFDKFFSFIFAFTAAFLFIIAVSRFLILMPYCILDKKVGPLKALRQSWIITNGYTIYLFAFILVISFLYFVGALTLLIGLFIVIPWVLITQALIYRELQEG